MALTINHAYTASGTDAGNGEVNKARWNAALVYSGTLDVTNGGTGATTARAAAQALGVPYIFAQSNAAQSVGAVITETTLATVSFAGGELGPNGFLVIYSLWSNNNSANTKTFNIRLGGAAGTLALTLSNTTNVFASTARYILNNNSASSQKFMTSTQVNSFFQGSAAIATASVNTASAWDLVFTGTKANSGDTLTLEGYQVLVCYGA